MERWTNLWGWAIALVVWLAVSGRLNAVRDFYVVQRLYFNRVYKNARAARGDLTDSHFQGFDDYLAAKAFFDWWEAASDGPGSLDSYGSEAEHNLYLVPARTKAAAVKLLRANKAVDKCLLETTPVQTLFTRRRRWEKEYQADHDSDLSADIGDKIGE